MKEVHRHHCRSHNKQLSIHESFCRHETCLSSSGGWAAGNISIIAPDDSANHYRPRRPHSAPTTAATTASAASASARLPGSSSPPTITDGSSFHLENADNFLATDLVLVLATLLLSYAMALRAWRLRHHIVLLSKELHTLLWLSEVRGILRAAAHQAKGGAGHAAERQSSTHSTPSCSPSLSEIRGTLRPATHQAKGDAGHAAADEISTGSMPYSPVGSLFDPALNKTNLISVVKEVITSSEVCVCSRVF